MLSIILLIATVIIVAIGAVCGFGRGILKQGVRAVLWGVLFVCSCFFIPEIAEKLPLWIAERFEITAVDVEQVIAELLKKVEILRKETYLIIPLADFVRTLLVPLIAVAFFWASGLVSWILYLVAALFLNKATENQGLVSQLTGMLAGIFLSLLCGAVTIYPLASVSSAIREGDAEQILCGEFEIVETVEKAYAGTPVKLVYQFTGTEWLAEAIHRLVSTVTVSEASARIWDELPGLVKLGSNGWQIYSLATDTASEGGSVKESAEQTVEAYFSLDFISEENQLLLLKRIKTAIGAAEEELISGLLGWLPVQSKEQVTKDVSVYAGVLDSLRTEGILDAMLEGRLLNITEETGTAVINTLYGLSNAETVVPEFINFLYAGVVSGVEKGLVRTENIDWSDRTKEEISEVVSVLCKLSGILAHIDSLSMEQKETALDAIKSLKDNEIVGKENYAALLKYMMSKM